MNDHHHPDSVEETAHRVLAELKIVVSGLEARLTHATKNDLDQMEARLVHEIKAIGNPSVDLSGLDALLVRSRAIAAKLAALDAQTQPKE